MNTPSGACCGPESTPRPKGYTTEEKGRWIDLDGMKTYVTGPSNAKKGIVFMYDILGLIPQSIHAADLISSCPSGPFLVVLPDWFEGHPIHQDWLPPKTVQDQQKIDRFFQTTGSVEMSLRRLQMVTPEIRVTYPNVDKWAVIGFCWGGKIAALASQVGTPFTASAQSSPAFLDWHDAQKIVIPTALMASNGEPRNEVQRYKNALTVDYYVEYFDDLEHGWMTSRAHFDDLVSIAAYEEGYLKLCHFLSNHM